MRNLRPFHRDSFSTPRLPFLGDGKKELRDTPNPRQETSCTSLVLVYWPPLLHIDSLHSLHRILGEAAHKLGPVL
jgi:hypothetical protein